MGPMDRMGRTGGQQLPAMRLLHGAQLSDKKALVK